MSAQTTATPEVVAAARFIARMLPDLAAGKSFEDAGNAVLGRDRKLMLIATADSEQGAFIRKHLAAKVFDAANAELSVERQARIAADEKRLAALAKAQA